MENKQLASYWIAEKVGIIIENLMKGYYSNQESFDKDWLNVFNQAGEMEKEQIINSYYNGMKNQQLRMIDKWHIDKNEEQYYNETYGNGQNLTQ